MHCRNLNDDDDTSNKIVIQLIKYLILMRAKIYSKKK